MAGSYDPYQNREITSKSTSNVEVVIHVVKCSFGIGILSLPFAIYRAGWISAIIIGVPTILILLYGIHILVRTMYKICTDKRMPYISYEDCVKISVEEGPPSFKKTATFMKYAVRAMLIALPLGTCIAYVIFIAKCLNQMYPILENQAHSTYLYEVIIFAPLFLINCLPNLHRLVIFSAFGNIVTFTCFGGMLYYFFGEGNMMAKEHPKVGAALHIALFPGTVMFALEAISVLLSLEEHMKTPQNFGGYFGMYNIGMIIVISIYCLIGITGYIKYGEEIHASINWNIPQDSWISQLIKYLFAVSIYCSYPLQFYPILAFLWEDHILSKVKPNRALAYEYLFRFIGTLLTIILALGMPEFDLVVTLVGAVCISTLGLFFPAILEFTYYWKITAGKYNFTMVKDLLIMLLGCLIFFAVVIGVIIDKVNISLYESDTNRTRSAYYGL